MIFKVISNSYEIKNTIPGITYLVHDNWNDWFKYCTLYNLTYIDNNLNRIFLGSIKIGEFNMNEDQSFPNIPKYFECLDENFFSLGQSSDFYENIKNIDDGIIKNDILESLNDIAFNEDLLVRALTQSVTKDSLLRYISLETVRNQFKRMAKGGDRLTKYDFTYTPPIIEDSSADPINIDFHVIPDSNPPTNIHVLVGRNGVGKTHLMKNMMNCILNKGSNEFGSITYDNSHRPSYQNLFSNLVFVSFSAFDKNIPIPNNDSIPFTYIGLSQNLCTDRFSSKTPDELCSEFADSLEACLLGDYSKFNLWRKAIDTLNSDPIFEYSCATDFLDYAIDIKNIDPLNKNLSILKSKKIFREKATRYFDLMSSGHKIIILTITKLIESIEEKTLVFLDEPEGHLHPPLLSAFIRALSELMIYKNAVSIVATHSPVVLQEVPRKCVWKLRRSGKYTSYERLIRESFGENVSQLTRDIFGLEVTNSGYHKLLSNLVDDNPNYDFNDIVTIFKDELGMEAKSILRGLLANRILDS